MSVRIRVAAIGVSHWHSLWDSAYLRHLAAMPDAELVGLHDPSAEVAAKRAAVLGGPPTFTDYRQMLDATRPDFVIALGHHRAMAEVALHLLDRGCPFLMEKPRGFAAVPLIQRYHPFMARARQLLAEGRFGTPGRPRPATRRGTRGGCSIRPRPAAGACATWARTASTCSCTSPGRTRR